MITTNKNTFPTNTTRTSPDNVNTFAQLLQNFTTAYDNKTDKNDPIYVELLERVSMVCALSVLKKCINAYSADHAKNPDNAKERIGLPTNSHAATLAKMRDDMKRADNLLKRTLYASDNATETRYKTGGKNAGNAYIVTVDKDLSEGLKRLTAENLGKGIDLKEEATLAILEQLKKQAEREPNEGADLERPFTMHELKRKVWIKSADSVGGGADREKGVRCFLHPVCSGRKTG